MSSRGSEATISNRVQALAAPLSGVACLLLGAAVLAGWACDVTVVKCVVPGMVAMKPNAAIGFVLLGMLLLGHRGQRWELRILCALAATALVSLSAATLAEYALGCNLGIDELLFRDNEIEPAGLFQPGRMSPITAVSFILLSAAMLQLQCSGGWARWGRRACLVVPFLVSARALVGYLYGVPTFYHLGQTSSIALHTTVGFVVASIGLMLAQRDSSLVAVLTSGGLGSRIARRLFLLMAAIPVGLGLLCLQGESLGLYDGRVGITVFVVLTSAMLMFSLAGWTRLVNRLDSQCEQAAAAARGFQQASERDSLTGLLNRRGFMERCEQELGRSRRAGTPLACLVFDLDFFKKINDTHGHGVGDEVLRQLGAALKTGCRPGDVVGRTGGEEFCLVLPDTDEDEALAVGERLCRRVASTPFVAGQLELSATMSGGSAQLPEGETKVQSLIDRADAALLVAKQTGRNKVVAYATLDDADLDVADCGPLKELSARDIMLPLGAQVRADCTIDQAAHLLMDLNLDALPVLGETGRFEGFICDQDLMGRLLDSSDKSPQVAGCRPSNVATFEASVPAVEIAKFLSRTGVQRVVIVSAGLPVGVVSRRGLLRWLLNASLLERAKEGRHSPRVGEALSNGLHRSIGELQLGIARLATIRDAADDEQMGGILAEATRIQEALEKLLRSCGHAQHRQVELVASGATFFG